MSAPPPPPKKNRIGANVPRFTNAENEPGQTSEERMANINKAKKAFNNWRSENPLPTPPSAQEVMNGLPKLSNYYGKSTGVFEPTKHKILNTPKNNTFPYSLITGANGAKGGKRTTKKKNSLRRKRRVLSRRV